MFEQQQSVPLRGPRLKLHATQLFLVQTYIVKISGADSLRISSRSHKNYSILFSCHVTQPYPSRIDRVLLIRWKGGFRATMAVEDIVTSC
jgi:hypothetical protein